MVIHFLDVYCRYETPLLYVAPPPYVRTMALSWAAMPVVWSFGRFPCSNSEISNCHQFFYLGLCEGKTCPAGLVVGFDITHHWPGRPKVDRLKNELADHIVSQIRWRKAVFPMTPKCGLELLWMNRESQFQISKLLVTRKGMTQL